MPPKQLDPCDDDRGAPDHRIERLEGLLPAVPLKPLDQELQVGLDRKPPGKAAWRRMAG